MIQQYPQRSAACCELEEVLSTAGETTTGSTIDIWMSVFGALSPRNEVCRTTVAICLHKAFVKLADNTVSSDFWKARSIWRDAHRYWSWILSDFAGAETYFTGTVSKFCKEASAMFECFDDSDDESDDEYDIPDLRVLPSDPAPHSIQV
jgi:hypothetical protein